MFKRTIIQLIFTFTLVLTANAQKRIPAVDDLMNVQSLFGAQISPDGKWVVYLVEETNWKQDAYITHLSLANVATGRTLQLTRGEKSCSSPRWSPDSAWIAFTSNRVGDKNQIFIIHPDGGEAIQLTKVENGVNSYAWSHDGREIAFTSNDIDSKTSKERKEHLGDFEVVRKEYNHSQIWTFALAEGLKEPVTGTQRTKGKDLSVGSFSWAPDGNRIAFSATINPDFINNATSDIYLLDLSDNSIKKLVAQPGPDNNPRWSPDGKQIVFSSAMGNPRFFHSNARLAVISMDGGTPRSVTDAFDEQPGLVEWNADGIYFSGLQKTASHLFRADPTTGKITRITSPDNFMAVGFSFTNDGKEIAFTAASPNSVSEIRCPISANPNCRRRKRNEVREPGSGGRVSAAAVQKPTMT